MYNSLIYIHILLNDKEIIFFFFIFYANNILFSTLSLSLSSLFFFCVCVCVCVCEYQRYDIFYTQDISLLYTRVEYIMYTYSFYAVDGAVAGI